MKIIFTLIVETIQEFSKIRPLSAELEQLNEQLEMKTERWMELSEKEG